MIRAVIFDLDDTLFPEKEYIESGYRHIAKIIKKTWKIDENKTSSLLWEFYKENPKKVFNRLLEAEGIQCTEKAISFLVEEYRSHKPKISFYSDVIPFLDFLNHKKIKKGIITDGYAVTQQRKLEALNAYDIFEKIIITDELGREFWKPHPKPFEIMSKELAIDFNNMMYIGDNPEKDFYINKIYPIATARINRDGIYKEKKYLNNIKETYSIKNLNDLYPYLTK
ncbi:MAG: HAD-IA family hydrolase [Synergistota bacterium]|nr:HAD-IA family hydrolase [Synergistota bacterium]